MTKLFNCFIELKPADPRWSAYGSGDELLVAVTTSMEAAQAVRRLYPEGVKFQIWANQCRRFWT